MSDSIMITGASSDIGMALMRRLLSKPETSILAHSFAGGERISALQEEFGASRIISVTADLSNRRDAEALAEKVLSLGVPRAFVHLPALRLQHERFTKLDWTELARDMAVQVESAGILLQCWLPKMAKLPGSRVVFLLSSVTLGIPPKFMSAYTVVKYAQLGLMRALAAEYASSQVRINAIAPSMVDTQFLSEITEIAIQMSASSNPLGRNATTQDLMEAFELLLSAQVEYIHGVSLPITGGTAA
jgi:3-oxoacyl-[acyl-carrier protein] reductase